MPKQSYWTVGICAYCNSLIPLAPYVDSNYYKLADSFRIRHDQQVPNTDCHAVGQYTYNDLKRVDLETIADLKIDLSFAEEILLCGPA